MSDYLERELRRQLAPVRAPESLWNARLEAVAQRPSSRSAQTPRKPIAWNPSRGFIFSPVLALILLTAAAGAVWKAAEPARRNPSSPAARSITLPASARTAVQPFSDSCLMCHTGAALVITPPAE